MALVLADRVKETTSSTGTGTFVLAGAEDGFQSFTAGVGDGNTTYYAAFLVGGDEYEVGIGTYTTSGTTLSRDTVLASSNSGNLVDFSAGTKEVFVTVPFAATVYEDASNNITTAGQITVGSDPTANLQVATKQYVDNVSAAAIHLHTAVRVEKEGNLNATYDNGTNGVGATLTNAGTQEALVIDGVTMAVNDRVLVYEQTDATENGVYDVTNIGSGSTNWVLTRSSDADSAGDGDPDALDEGSYFYVQEGDAGAGESYVCNVNTTIVFGTTDITFAQFSAAPEFTAGTNIDITNRTISVTGTVANANLLDSLDSNQFLRSDAADTKSSGNLTFADSVRAVYGDSLDFQIYHAGGTINHLVGLAGHSTYITGGTDLYLRGVNGEEGVTINGNGAVELFHDNSKKFETTSTGVTVTGSLSGNVTGDLTGNADTATTWETSRSLTLSGDVTGTATGIDGSGNISVTTSIASNSVALGTDTTGNYVASLVAGNAIDLQNNTGEGATPTIDVDLSELATSTTDGDGDFFVVVDDSNGQHKLTKANIGLSGFNNDANFSTTTGTVTSVTVTGGDGLTGTGTVTGSGTITLNVAGGTGLTANADDISLDDTAVTPGSYTYASITVDQQGRLTAASSGDDPQAFPSGTKMLFVQSTAPSGWTKDTTNNDNSAIRIVTGTASTGGSADFSTALATPSVSGSVSVTLANATAGGTLDSVSTGGTVGNHTLAINRMPAHNHSVYSNNGFFAGDSWGLFYNGRNNSIASNNVNNRFYNYNTAQGQAVLGNRGSTAAHNHSFTGSSHNHTFTGTAHTHTVSSASLSSATASINVKYVDVIVATKD